MIVANVRFKRLCLLAGLSLGLVSCCGQKVFLDSNGAGELIYAPFGGIQHTARRFPVE
jgi:hypothetical protein